jgi:hypothetical protein
MAVLNYKVVYKISLLHMLSSVLNSDGMLTELNVFSLCEFWL